MKSLSPATTASKVTPDEQENSNSKWGTPDLLGDEISRAHELNGHLIQLADQVHSMNEGNKRNHFQLQTRLEELRKQILEHEGLEKRHFISKSGLEIKIKKLHRQFIDLCYKRVGIAVSIDMQKMRKIKISSRDADATIPFKWALTVLYDEPQSYFDWNNFKKQVFNAEASGDFIERVGKMHAKDFKPYHRKRTLFFIESYKKYSICQEFEVCWAEIQKLHRAAEYMKDSWQLLDEITKLETQFHQLPQKQRQTAQTYDKLTMRAAAMQDRLQTCNKVISLLQDKEKKLRDLAAMGKQNWQKIAILVQQAKQLTATAVSPMQLCTCAIF